MALFETHREHFEKFWHPDNVLDPRVLTVHQKTKVDFHCPEGHEFSAPVSRIARVAVDRFCGECLSVSHLNPAILPFYDYGRNPSPRRARATGGKGGLWYFCPRGHSVLRKGVVTPESLSERCAKCSSFLSRHPVRASWWDSSANSVTPEEVSPSDHTPREFLCPKGHRFSLDPWSTTSTFCPKCSFRSLLDVHTEIVSKYWDYQRNSVRPEKVSYGNSKDRFHFRCPEGHSFLSHVHRIGYHTREFCPECRLRNWSFESCFPAAANLWDSDINTRSASRVYAGAGGLFAFQCHKGHRYRCSLRAAARGSACPECFPASVIEDEVFREVHRFLSSVKRDAGLGRADRDLISPYEVDILVPELRVAIEVNGDYWHSDEVVLPRRGMTARDFHSRKRFLAEERGYQMLFVWEHDWRHHFDQVRQALMDVLGMTSKEGTRSASSPPPSTLLPVPQILGQEASVRDAGCYTCGTCC